MIGLTNILQMTEKDFFRNKVDSLIIIIDSFLIEEKNAKRIQGLYKDSDKDVWWTFFIPSGEYEDDVIEEVCRLYKLNWERPNLDIKITKGEQEVSFTKSIYGVYFEFHRKPY